MVGHSPYALKRLFFWLLHEVGMDKYAITNYLKSHKINVNNGMLNSWASEGNRPSWKTWQKTYMALNELLVDYGLTVDDFTLETTYTPANLHQLRKMLDMSADDFADALSLNTTRLLLLESQSNLNKRVIGFKDFQAVCERMMQKG